MNKETSVDVEVLSDLDFDDHTLKITIVMRRLNYKDALAVAENYLKLGTKETFNDPSGR